MRFTKAAPDENYSIMRFLSESGRWELGLSPALFGIRVQAGIAGSMGIIINYCAGADASFALRLLVCLVTILEPVPESISEREILRIMPGFERKPIHLDPCWERLQEMERAVLANSCPAPVPTQ